MDKRRFGLAILTLLVTSIAPSVVVAQNPDEAAIRSIQVRQVDAWNRHDAKAYAALFTPNGDVVNVVGWWWKGPAEIEQKLAAGFAFVFRESLLSITQVEVRFITRDIAVAHVLWTMTGARTPPGMPEPRQGIQIQVLKKTGGKWLIASFQNTNSIPERPFPAGPITPGAPPKS